MATFTNYKDELKKCPYNPLHRVSARRYQQHIVACAKSGLYEELSQCPYNASHRVPQKELNNHILSCKDNHAIIREIVETSEARKCGEMIGPNPALTRAEETVLSSENWDDNPNPKSYIIKGLEENESEIHDSKDSDEKDVIIKTGIELQRLKPAERKRYYKELLESQKSKIKVEDHDGRSSVMSSQSTEPPPSIFSESENANLTDDTSSTFRASPSNNIKQEKGDNNEDSHLNFRRPRSQPLGGIGRGSIRPMSSSSPSPSLRSINDSALTFDRSSVSTPIGSESSFHIDYGNSFLNRSVKRERDYIPFISDRFEDGDEDDDEHQSKHH